MSERALALLAADGDEGRGATTVNEEQRLAFDLVPQLAEALDTGNRLSVKLDDNIARAQTRTRGGTPGLHSRDHDTVGDVFGKAELAAQFGGELL
jgi:hypothetical protein